MRGLLSQIINAVNFEESTTVLGFRDDGLYELVSKLALDEKCNKLFNEKTKKNTLVRKLNVRLIENILEEDKDKKILDYLGLNIHDKEEFFQLLQSGNSILFIVEEIDKLKSPEKIISTLDQLIKQYKNNYFVYLLENVNVFVDLHMKLEPNSSFFDNTILLPLEREQEKAYLESMCVNIFGRIESPTKLKKIYNQSSGHYELYKRLYKAEITGNYDSFENYARRLTRSFGDDTLKIFRKVINKVELSNREEELILVYKKLGFIKNNKITIPILQKYILDLTPKESILLSDDGQIIFSNIQEFSKTEIKVLKTFLENEGEIVTKEELGFLIWGNKVDKKYSPWAIDQIIFRIRLKLDKLNLYGEIKTIHGKGYVFQGAK